MSQQGSMYFFVSWAKERIDEMDAASLSLSAGKQLEQQQATFRNLAAAQAKAWGETAEKFRAAAGKVAAARAVNVEAALKQLQSDASQAEARLQKLKQAGSESWSVMSSVLAESRKAFDQANKAAGRAEAR